MSKSILTQSRLRELFDYNSETGVFTRKQNKTRTDLVGKPAGWVMTKGHLSIEIDYRSYLAHRLAWLYMFGKWPTNQIDHINRMKADNRIANLRDVGQSENQHNSSRRKDNWSGLIGINWVPKSCSWRARIGVNGKDIHLGTFPNKEAASAAYQAAKLIYHPTAPVA